jgi:hypothetical protein
VAIIDPDGLFYGDRMAKLSLLARLYWPYFFVASNANGRLELNYHRIANRVFARFPSVPSEHEINGYLKEYADAHLLFIYRFNGQVWAQWDVSEKFLPTYKDAAAKRSPNPGPAFLEWKNEYVKLKEQSLSVSPFTCNDFEKSPEEFKNPLKNLDGIGDGIGVGVGIKTCSSDLEPSSDSGLESKPTNASNGSKGRTAEERWGTKERSHAFRDSFWPIWPRKVAKAAAERAWFKHASSSEIASSIVKAVKDQTAMLTVDGLTFCPHAATWLNDKRFLDDPNEAALTPAVPLKPEHREWRPAWEGDRD